MTLKEIKQAVKDLDPAISSRSEAFKVATITLAFTQRGIGTKRTAAFTGYPLRLVQEVKARYVANGLIRGRKFFHGGWFDKNGGISFWLDISVGMGLLKRSEKTA